MLFNKDGVLILDEDMMVSPSFKQIMEDGVVTSDEIDAQIKKVSDLLHDAEKHFSAEDLECVEHLLVESNVLFAVFNKFQIQNL
jgi:hypothetical protein